MKHAQKLVEQLNFLINSSTAYAETDLWIVQRGTQDAVVLCNRLESAIERASLPGSSYAKQLEGARGLPQPHRFNGVRHIAMGLRDDLVAGWVESVVELVHADTHGDYLEMAETLLDAGYKDPAAVVAGTSLEVHVRTLCVKHGVDITMPNGAPKKTDVMHADLKKAGIYGALEQKQITAWMDLRNKAAHGDYASYDKGQVASFIRGVHAFMMKHSA
ncbi:hypothetical protein ACFYQQ_09730 [Streptomyces sp. NPDC005496]|uniref:hypothetical protein n=1 Tax=unclassified Streptomyces TaxID=2593676 RepID=UPI0033B7592A